MLAQRLAPGSFQQPGVFQAQAGLDGCGFDDCLFVLAPPVVGVIAFNPNLADNLVMNPQRYADSRYRPGVCRSGLLRRPRPGFSRRCVVCWRGLVYRRQLVERHHFQLVVQVAGCSAARLAPQPAHLFLVKLAGFFKRGLQAGHQAEVFDGNRQLVSQDLQNHDVVLVECPRLSALHIQRSDHVHLRC